jgi:hypothetical protein
MIAAITQYLQGHVRESLPLYVYRQMMRIDYVSDWSSKTGHDRIEEMLEEAFGEHNIQETDDELLLDPQDGEKSIPWHEAMDNAFSNWKEFAIRLLLRNLHILSISLFLLECALQLI